MVKHSLKTLLEALESALSPQVQRSAERDATELDQFLSTERINAWSRMLSLTRWLGINCASIKDHLFTVPDPLLAQAISTPFGLKLATSMICGDNSTRLESETCSSILRLLFEELWCMPDISHRVHLDVLVGFYAVNGGYRGSDRSSFFRLYFHLAPSTLFQRSNTSWTLTSHKHQRNCPSKTFLAY